MQIPVFKTRKTLFLLSYFNVLYKKNQELTVFFVFFLYCSEQKIVLKKTVNKHVLMFHVP